MKTPEIIMVAFLVTAVIVGSVAGAVTFFVGPQWGNDQYVHQGYMMLPKEKALEFVAKHSEDATIVTYSADDEWAVTYNFTSDERVYNGIAGKEDWAWSFAKWWLLGLCFVAFSGFGGLILWGFIAPEKE